MKIREYRIVLPLTVEEYHRGQLWSVAAASLEETGGGEGVEVIENREFDNIPLLNGRYTQGQYTRKIYHIKNKIPKWVRWAIPDGATRVHEEAWNAYPYCRTKLTNPEYMGEDFEVTIESLHVDDRGETENALNLTGERLSKRDKEGIQVLDIRSDKDLKRADINPKMDPKEFQSRDGRGPLVEENWKETVVPAMCCYKVVSCHIQMRVFQEKLETFSHKQYRRLFTKFNREVFCGLEDWNHLTMEDIREYEDKVAEMLVVRRNQGNIRGMVA